MGLLCLKSVNRFDMEVVRRYHITMIVVKIKIDGNMMNKNPRELHTMVGYDYVAAKRINPNQCVLELGSKCTVLSVS